MTRKTTTPTHRVQRLVFRGFANLNKALDTYAPATDPECDWKWSSLRCEPRGECRFYYKVCLGSGQLLVGWRSRD